MRNEAGQEATEEMSAFKGVVNLFIVVRLYLSQRITCFHGQVRGGTGKWLQAAKSPSDSETAHETAPAARTLGVSPLFGEEGWGVGGGGYLNQ